MNGFSILMLIFGLAILLVGLYMYSGEGHKIDYLAWRAQFKGLTKSGWKNVGKWTMIASIIPFILAIIGLFLDV